jgi:hypothetical protein
MGRIIHKETFYSIYLGGLFEVLGFLIWGGLVVLCMDWGCGGVKFCLFSVVFPVMCISNVSPRFYFRKHAFCFLPLAAILESPNATDYISMESPRSLAIDDA